MKRRPDRKPNDSQQAVMFEHLHAVVDYLKDHYPQVQQQSEMTAGFSSSSIGVMGSGFGDPVGNAVTSDRPSPSEWAQDCLTLIDEFYAMGKSVENRVRRLMPPEADSAGEPGCKSCARLAKNWAVVHRSERCRWCYDFWLVEKQDPPVDLLIARRDGKRITDRMVRDALGRKSA